MHTKIPTGIGKILFALLIYGGSALGATFMLHKDPNGMVSPFKIKQAPLYEFTREYVRLTGQQIEVAGKWEDELSGTVTLFINNPIKENVLTELFHQVLKENGFSAVDAPGKTGWILMRSRDARDAALPIYDSTDIPGSYRLMTVVHSLKYIDSESVARNIRSFMPANSRIIPATSMMVMITDSGHNIQKLMKIIQLLDTQEAGVKAKKYLVESRNQQECKDQEMKIEKLTVERLEIQDSNSNPTFTITKDSKSGPTQVKINRGKK